MKLTLAWRQLFHQRARLLAAIAGIVFAVVLIMVQLGFQAALYESATLHYDHMTADIVLLSPQYEAIMYNNSGFPLQRLNQAYAVDGVASTLPVYGSFVAWKNPWTHKERTMYMFGFRWAPRPHRRRHAPRRARPAWFGDLRSRLRCYRLRTSRTGVRPWETRRAAAESCSAGRLGPR